MRSEHHDRDPERFLIPLVGLSIWLIEQIGGFRNNKFLKPLSFSAILNTIAFESVESLFCFQSLFAGRAMPQSRSPSTPPPIGLDPLQAKVECARSEGRHQQALEVAKQLFKGSPTTEHRTLLKTVTVERARQLRKQGYNRDAAATLEAGIRLDEANPAWIEELAREIALTGETEKISAFRSRLPTDSPITKDLELQILDAAIEKEAAGRTLVPDALRADFDRVLLAFTQLERGQDDAVRETLQAIGLRSPFNEWKLLLRGLQAWYQQDDSRAIDNWQRLSPTRLPAQLVAPFRLKIDSAFRTAQPKDLQALLSMRLPAPSRSRDRAAAAIDSPLDESRQIVGCRLEESRAYRCASSVNKRPAWCRVSPTAFIGPSLMVFRPIFRIIGVFSARLSLIEIFSACSPSASNDWTDLS